MCACLLALRANALHLLFLLRRIATRRCYCCFAASCASRCTPRGERASMWNSTRGSSGDVRMWGRASFGTPLLADRARMGSQRVCVCVCVRVCVCVFDGQAEKWRQLHRFCNKKKRNQLTKAARRYAQSPWELGLARHCFTILKDCNYEFKHSTLRGWPD